MEESNSTFDYEASSSSKINNFGETKTISPQVEIIRNDANDHLLKLSILPKNKTNTVEIEYSFSNLVEMFSKPLESNTKEVCAFTPAIFKDNYRKKEKAISCSVLVYDLDGLPDQTTASDVIEAIQEYQVICYSSYSHKLPDKGARFRVIIALNKNIPAENYSALANAFKSKLGKFSSGIDVSGMNVAQMFYLPAIPSERKQSFDFKAHLGEPLNWESIIDGSKLPESDNQHLGADGNSSIGIGSRNKELNKFAFNLRRHGAELQDIFDKVMAKNLKECTPPLSQEEVLQICKSVSNQETLGWFFQEEMSHGTVAKSLIQTHGDRLKWTSDTKEWYIFDESGYWNLCDSVSLGKLFVAEIEMLQKRVSNNSTLDFEIKAKWIKRLQSANNSGFTKGVISMLPSFTKLKFKFTELDSDHYLVGLRDGMCLDLSKVSVRPIQSTDNLSKSIGTSYDVKATCPQWEKSVLEWSCGDKELALFLQELVGYSLSGLTTDHRLYFLYGNGKNGKSVFINILSALFGQNGLSIDPSSLMDLKRSAGQATGDIARLVGKRFISSNELPNNGMFNEEFVKRFTAGDTIVARPVFGKDFEFTPVGKLFISGNNQPIIRGRDDGIWRRMTLIPFDAKITSPDIFLDQKLKNELSGILNWAIEGWKIFLLNNKKLKTPHIIVNATAQYRNDMDILARWKNDCLQPVAFEKLSFSAVYASYKQWCMEESISFMSSSSFNREIKKIFDTKRSKDGNVILGFCLGSSRGGDSILLN